MLVLAIFIAETFAVDQIDGFLTVTAVMSGDNFARSRVNILHGKEVVMLNEVYLLKFTALVDHRKRMIVTTPKLDGAHRKEGCKHRNRQTREEHADW